MAKTRFKPRRSSAPAPRWKRSKCESKVRYMDELQAAHFGAMQGQRAYLCESCGSWHLTSKEAP